MKRYWWLVVYPNGVRLVEWMSVGEAEVKERAVGGRMDRVRMVEVKELNGQAVVGEPQEGEK